MVASLNTLITTAEALETIDLALAESQGSGIFVSLSACETALSRFSENQIGQNVRKNTFSLTVTSYFGKRSASASTTELDPKAIIQTLRRAEDLARIAPEDPEWVELLPAPTYSDKPNGMASQRTPAFDPATATLSPLRKGEIIQEVCASSKAAGVNGSGTLSFKASLNAIGNSAGLRGCDRTTEADFSFTARIDNGSSWNRCSAWSIEQLPIPELTQQVIERAIASRNPQAIAPGDYTVIFEPNAFASLLPWIVWNMDARAADEGRSFMSLLDDKGNPVGNKVGEELFNSLVQIRRDPTHPLLQGGRFFGNGLSNEPLDLVHDGVPQTLSYSRYWAKEQDKEPTGAFYPLVMAGGDRSAADLIASTERGILVSRAWYVRYVNPRTLEVTGMTRDGTFLIENGKIARPIKNLRFNQSLPDMLNNVVALGQAKRCGSSVIPSCKVANFHFSSITDSI